jgi:hypothetical protein
MVGMILKGELKLPSSRPCNLSQSKVRVLIFPKWEDQ